LEGGCYSLFDGTTLSITCKDKEVQKHQSQNLVTSYFLYSVTAAPFSFVSGKFCGDDDDDLESL